MPEEQIELPGLGEFNDFEPSAAAVSRFYVEHGERLQNLEFMLTWRVKAQLFVYKLEVRWPLTQEGDLLCILKAVSTEGPLIAFHSDRTIVAVLGSLSGRLRAGKLKWRVDEYPPTNYEEIAGAIASGVRQHKG